MNYKWLLLLLTLSIFSANAQSYQSSIEIIEQFDDVKLVAFIRESDLENYPVWHSVKQAPPLTIVKAIQAVHDYHKNNNAEWDDETVNEIELKEIPHHKNNWHYLIKIKTNHSGKAKYQVYVVLMTGKVIPAITQTESYK